MEDFLENGAVNWSKVALLATGISFSVSFSLLIDWNIFHHLFLVSMKMMILLSVQYDASVP